MTVLIKKPIAKQNKIVHSLLTRSLMAFLQGSKGQQGYLGETGPIGEQGEMGFIGQKGARGTMGPVVRHPQTV